MIFLMTKNLTLPKLSRTVIEIGNASLGMYLSHVVILELLVSKLEFAQQNSISSIAVLTILTLFFSLGITSILGQLPYLHVFSGYNRRKF
jgi:surface polysaccharide O-acyltransferase-like enzyme